MDHVRTIQVIVDEHKEQMPTGVVAGVLKQCQEAYDVMSNLYKLNWTVVKAHAQVHEVEDEEPFASAELSHATQTLIVEAVDKPPDHLFTRDMPNHGMVMKSWLKFSMPCIMNGNNMIIIHSIVPYNPHKRAREPESPTEAGP